MKNAVREIGYDFAWGAVGALALFIFFAWLGTLAINATIDAFGARAFDSTDDVANRERSGMRIYTDHGTGCQYLATRSGELTPRLDRLAKPICGSTNGTE
jgi:hypothetical protein